MINLRLKFIGKSADAADSKSTLVKAKSNIFFFHFQSVKPHVDHQAQAYVAPRRVMAETNGNAPKIANGTKPKWGGAEICPRCGKSVRSVFHASYFLLCLKNQQKIFHLKRLKILVKLIWVFTILLMNVAI